MCCKLCVTGDQDGVAQRPQRNPAKHKLDMFITGFPFFLMQNGITALFLFKYSSGLQKKKGIEKIKEKIGKFKLKEL